ncbi:hypothetical protein BaRGS_00001331 [Batillaria attramentaria]|uniref:Uncharacterized protein n=1 Tax=Batillaria attramentaria TaxID=370345 RepID=A0ABD0M7H3_9CAEN
MKEKLLDKPTIDAYHSYVQSQIRSDLNSIALGPGRLPTRAAIGLILFGLCCLIVGVCLVTLRYLHVYFWDWNHQFVGPFFIILFLMCCSGATYACLLAVRRSNRFRRDLYFHPLGDYGIAAVPREDLIHEQELKHDLKSGTTPHKSVLPRSEAYSHTNLARDGRGHHNQAYRPGPGDPYRRPPQDPRRGPPHPGDRRRPPPDDRRRGGPPPDGRRGPPDDRRRYPDDRRGPPDGRRGPPPEGRRGPPPEGEYRRGPPPSDGRRGPPPDGYRGPPRGPPPEGYRGTPPERRGPPPHYNGDDRRGPPPDDRRGPPPDDRRGPPPDDRRPRGVPHFRERSPDDDMGKVKLDIDKESESVL